MNKHTILNETKLVNPQKQRNQTLQLIPLTQKRGMEEIGIVPEHLQLKVHRTAKCD
jgi:hypothetical protein